MTHSTNRFAQWAANPVVLWATFCATVVCFVLFSVLQNRLGLTLLDSAYLPGMIRAGLAALDDVNRDRHVWITLTLDTAFPAIYGTLFLGIIARFGRSARLLVLPVLTVVFDLAENITQVALLRGADALVILKAGLTCGKFACFSATALVAVALVLRAAVRR